MLKICLEKGDHVGFRRLVETILPATFWGNDRVCGRHFVSGKAAKSWNRFNVDWVPTLCLGHSKNEVGPKSLEKAAERSQRVCDREQIKKKPHKNEGCSN